MPLKIKWIKGVAHVHGTVAGRRIRKGLGTRDPQLAEHQRAQIEGRLLRASIYGEESEITFAEACLKYLEEGGGPGARSQSMNTKPFFSASVNASVSQPIPRMAVVISAATARMRRIVRLDVGQDVNLLFVFVLKQANRRCGEINGLFGCRIFFLFFDCDQRCNSLNSVKE